MSTPESWRAPPRRRTCSPAHSLDPCSSRRSTTRPRWAGRLRWTSKPGGDLTAPAAKSDPEVELLANGDLLVPVASNGGWRITRLAPETPGYAGWLSFVQQRDRSPGIFARGVGFWTAAIVVLVGTWLGFLFFVLLVKAVFD